MVTSGKQSDDFCPPPESPRGSHLADVQQGSGEMEWFYKLLEENPRVPQVLQPEKKGPGIYTGKPGLPCLITTLYTACPESKNMLVEPRHFGHRNVLKDQPKRISKLDTLER